MSDKETSMTSTNAIDLLKKDHRDHVAMFEEFTKLKHPQERVKLINTIVTELAVHATAEEKHLYPVMADDPKTIEAIEEHHALKLIMAEVADMKGDEPNIEGKVKVLGEMVEHHIKEEEQDLFPKLERIQANLIEIGKKIADEKDRLKAGMGTVGNQKADQLGGAPRPA